MQQRCVLGGLESRWKLAGEVATSRSYARGAKAAGEPPGDNPDLSYTMAFVTAIGGVSAYMTKKSSVGVSGQF